MMSSHHNYRVYICNVANSKNEDRFSEMTTTFKGSEITIVGVYDGHGGEHCADYISKTLPRTLALNLNKNENLPIAETISSTFLEVDNSIIQGLRDKFKVFLTWPLPNSVRQKAIDTRLRNGNNKKVALRARSGTTALIAVIEEDHITLSSIGDCRAVLGRMELPDKEVKAETLTIDQNGDNQSERTRIVNEHPASEAQTLFAGSRLFGHISVTRSFGDVFYKEPNTAYSEYVFGSAQLTCSGQLSFHQNMKHFYPLIKTPPYLSSVPDIIHHRRSSNDRFLIVASDGVWGLEGITNEWAVEKVQNGLERGDNPSKYMMAEVMKFHPGDDVTIIVIAFQ